MKQQLFVGYQPKIELMNPVFNRNFVKAGGGLWTSTFIDNDSYSDWIEWCVGNNFWSTDNIEGWLLTVNKDVRILEIDSLEDAKKAFSKYSYSLHGIMNFLDYEKMSKDYDGFHLTNKGEIQTRWDINNSLYGFDCESTHWFRWVFDKVESIGKLKLPS